MAFSSSSSIPKSYKYDVFLSFRGEDTRKNFVDHLYHALQHKSIKTYKDDKEIKKGERINDELLGSIEDSKFYIIVLSKNYASSSWCLDELVKIMECGKTTEHKAYPIFYDVEPTEVRNQSGAVGKAFARHEKKAAAGKWRNALEEAADLAGWELKHTANGHEAIFIQKVIDQLSLELRSINFSIDEQLVGMETRIMDVVKSLANDFDDVRMIGIKGIGGGGKTTLARAVFDHISYEFEGKSFVENVREISKDSSSGLKSLQKQILSDVLNDIHISVSGVQDGKNLMQRTMRDRKVLIVLDDVDGRDQLEALAGKPSWFKTGSRVIITTRDEQVLIAHNVKLIHDVSLLSDKEAVCLFSRYAFGREIPKQGYEELAGRVVRYANGLPLTITVLGSFLCGKEEFEWRDALDRLKTIPLNETLAKLELSYTGLEEDYKEIFLDVACILKGWQKKDAIKALESCGFHARNGLRVLEQKSLITISYGEHLGMHDHIEEMGKNIVRRLHPDKPNKHSRLWINKEIEDILANDSGTLATRCIRVRTWELNLEIAMKSLRNMKELRYLDANFGAHGELDKVSQYLPNSLRYLSWHHYPFMSLPTTFKADNLVSLMMAQSNIVQLWEGGERKVLNKLRFLDISYSAMRTLDLGLTPNLEMLNLRGCGRLVELHMLFGCLKLKFVDLMGSKLRSLDLRSAINLEVLDLESCLDLVELHMPYRYLNLRSLNLNHSRVRLRKLDIGLTPNLELLNLNYCYHLEELKMAGECQNLISLGITYLSWRTLDLCLTPNLKHLHLKNCHDLEELHMANECQKLNFLDSGCSMLKILDLRLITNLETLSLGGCGDFVELHMPVPCLKLRSFLLIDSKIRTLDLGSTPNLQLLHLEGCKDLVELQMPSRCLNLISLKITKSKLRVLDIGLTPNLNYLNLENSHDLEELHMAGECQNLATLNISHSKLKTLDLGMTPNLKKLYLKRCHNLVEFHPPIECLKALVYLDLGLRFRSFLFHIEDSTCRSVDESLEVGSLSKVHLIVKPLETCTIHPSNSWPKFQYTCFCKQDLALLSRIVEKLDSVGLCACTNLETFSRSIYGLGRLMKLTLESYREIPKDLDQLECLEELVLSSTKVKNLPDSICMFKHLKFLQLESCGNLEKLPEDLGLLKCLEELIVSSTKIKNLPDSICMLKHLKFLQLQSCWLLEKLPENLDQLECLEKLILIECMLLEDIPESICNMQCLQVLYMEDTCISQLPQNIVLSKGLHIYGSRGILQSCGFTSEIVSSGGDKYCFVDV